MCVHMCTYVYICIYIYIYIYIFARHSVYQALGSGVLSNA